MDINTVLDSKLSKSKEIKPIFDFDQILLLFMQIMLQGNK